MRDPQKYPNLSSWFDGLEARESYRGPHAPCSHAGSSAVNLKCCCGAGTQSDYHTHNHDLPPQVHSVVVAVSTVSV